MARDSVIYGTGMTEDERAAFVALQRSFQAWRTAIAEECESTATRIWRRALELQGKPIPELPPSSPQDAVASELPIPF